MTLPATTDAATLMQIISRAATDPNVDVSKMERMFAMYREMDATRAERDFNGAMRTTQQAIPAIFKNKKADKHSYANLEAVLDVIAPIYTENGFSLSFGNEDAPVEKYYRVVCFVSHVGGHTRKYQADLPMDVSGSKNPTQGFGSTVAYGRRYLQMMIFNIATTDDNDGAGTAGSGNITAEQVAEITKLHAENGLNIDAFAEWLKVEKIADLPASDYQRAMNALNGKIAERAKKAAKQ